ncbi:MAG: hypothetical protein FJ255_02605 [Phycisphaerae bacterium]|nr:hypothetical protein [Phycisphaerae bacterium]
MLALPIALVALATQPELALRGHREAPPGAVSAVGVDGVSAGSDAPVLVGWDIVAELPEEWREPGREWAELADALWRARVRLERGDFALAERTLEPWLPKVRGRRGPTAMLVGDGLLRCRLRRGARTSAIDAWLTWLAAGDGSPALHLDSGRPVASRSEDPAVVPDAGLGLVPELPPMWLDTPAVRALGEAASPETSASWGVLAQAYKASAATEGGSTPDLAPLLAAVTGPATADLRSQGVRLVAAVVLSRAGDARQRDQARGVLLSLSALDERPWVEAWRRAAIGRSLLREPERERRLEGVLEMLHVPARLPEASPYLTGLVLAESAVAMRELGDAAAGERLYQEFAALGDTHPAWQWAPIRGWGRAAPARPAASNGTTDPAATPTEPGVPPP